MSTASLLGCAIAVLQSVFVSPKLDRTSSSSTGVFLEPRHESPIAVDAVSGWRLAEGTADIMWNFTRSSMPCPMLSSSLLQGSDISSPSLLQNLNWTQSAWWYKSSILAGIGRLPASHGNQTLVGMAPFQHLRKTSMTALFSSAPPAATQESVIFDWDMINRTDALPLKENVWLEESLKSFIDIRSQWLFLSAQPLGHWRGVGLHRHGRSFAALATGKKIWLFFPPASRAMAAQEQRIAHGLSVRRLWDWLASDAGIPQETTVPPTAPREEEPVVCAQAAGEVMVVPNRWYHGTIPVGDALGVTIVENSPRRDPREAVREEM
jgi:hypothetical protein